MIEQGTPDEQWVHERCGDHPHITSVSDIQGSLQDRRQFNDVWRDLQSFEHDITLTLP